MMSVTHSEYSKSRKLWKMIKCAIFHKINNYFLFFFNGLEFNRPITKKRILVRPSIVILYTHLIRLPKVHTCTLNTIQVMYVYC